MGSSQQLTMMNQLDNEIALDEDEVSKVPDNSNIV
jgi:hypothetical protein